MNLAKYLNIALVLVVLTCYAGSFIALPAFHSHHTSLFASATLNAAERGHTTPYHPTSCIVCSRITTAYHPVTGVSVGTAILVPRPYVTQKVEPLTSIESALARQGRAPPFLSI